MLYKNELREEALRKFYGNDTSLNYDESVYKDADATIPFVQDLLSLWDFTFQTWIAIVKGDYKDQNSIEYQVFIFLLTFIANVTLLNLIVAIMSDAYGEVMTNITAKKRKSLN